MSKGLTTSNRTGSTTEKPTETQRTRSSRSSCLRDEPPGHSRKPAMVAVMKFAMVPAALPRRPSRGRAGRGPASGGLTRAELQVRHEPREHHPRPAQVDNPRGFAPRHAHVPGEGREHPPEH